MLLATPNVRNAPIRGQKSERVTTFAEPKLRQMKIDSPEGIGDASIDRVKSNPSSLPSFPSSPHFAALAVYDLTLSAPRSLKCSLKKSTRHMLASSSSFFPAFTVEYSGRNLFLISTDTDTDYRQISADYLPIFFLTHSP